MLPLDAPPRSLCVLRLSAIGDTCHVVPVIRTLQQAWPQTRISWIIGAVEARLMSLLDGVDLIIADKRAGPAGGTALARRLGTTSFDCLLHMQLSLRASLIARRVRAPLKVGFDRARARELQWLFTNARIPARSREHVQDSLFGFAAALGVTHRQMRWDLPLPEAARARAERLIPAGNTLVISPCSSHPLRNWLPARYAAVADHAVRSHGLRIILAGGPSAAERSMGEAIRRAARVELEDQIGRDTLPEMLALLARATLLLTPDSGPAHMATMVGTPVLGLYAATNPQRSGPYRSRQWCVDAWPRAARRFRNRAAEELPWTAKIEEPGVMDLIGVDEVCARLDELLGFLSVPADTAERGCDEARAHE